MEFTSESLLLFLVVAIFLFIYFLITRVWIKVDERNKESSSNTNKIINKYYIYLESYEITYLQKKEK